MTLLIVALLLSAVLGQESTDQPAQKEQAVYGPLTNKIASRLTSPSGSAWLAWSVPLVKMVGSVGCGSDNNCCAHHVGRDHHGLTIDSSKNASGDRHLQILLRYAQGEVRDMELVSSDCTIKTDGITLEWIDDVSPSQSVAFFTGVVEGTISSVKRLDGENAIVAIALHADVSADDVLARLVAPQVKEDYREQAAFWLGMARGQRGLEILNKLVANDASPEFREHLATALAQNHTPEATGELISMARQDPSGEVRGQALFWLAEKAGKKATDTIVGALENDPDLEVRKQALFALSQMEEGEGIPLLIQVAKGKYDRELRETAFFWLGQSKDPRALDFIEEVLNR